MRPTVEAVAADGIALPGCAPWRFFPLLTPERLLRAFATGGSRDSVTWLDFATIASASTSAYFECDVAWMLAQNIKPGVSAEVHGSAFGVGRRAAADVNIDAPTIALLDLLCAEWKLPVLLSFYPQRNKLAAAWDRRFGFERTGVIPLADVWNGEADNLIVTARFASTATMSKKENAQ